MMRMLSMQPAVDELIKAAVTIESGLSGLCASLVQVRAELPDSSLGDGRMCGIDALRMIVGAPIETSQHSRPLRCETSMPPEVVVALICWR